MPVRSRGEQGPPHIKASCPTRRCVPSAKPTDINRKVGHSGLYIKSYMLKHLCSQHTQQNAYTPRHLTHFRWRGTAGIPPYRSEHFSLHISLISSCLLPQHVTEVLLDADSTICHAVPEGLILGQVPWKLRAPSPLLSGGIRRLNYTYTVPDGGSGRTEATSHESIKCQSPLFFWTRCAAWEDGTEICPGRWIPQLTLQK